MLTTSTLVDTSRASHGTSEGTADTDEGSSSKLVVKLQGGRMVETVIIDHTDDRSKAGGTVRLTHGELGMPVLKHAFCRPYNSLRLIPSRL